MNFHPLKRLVSSSRMFFAGAIALVTFTAARAAGTGDKPKRHTGFLGL